MLAAATRAPRLVKAAAQGRPDQQTVVVDTGDFYFNPNEVHIQPGDTVRWTNNGNISHTSTSADEPAVWDSGNLAPGASFAFTFETAGTYDYVCTYHPQMVGQVIVEGAETETPSPTATDATTTTPTLTPTVTATPTEIVTGTTMTPTPAPTASAVPSGPEIQLEEVATGLTAPVDLDAPPDDSGRLFVVEQVGRIRIVDANGTLEESPFLDVSDRLPELGANYDERGLLGLAFHPDFAANGLFYVYYSIPLRDTAPDGYNHTERLSEFHVSDVDPNTVDMSSERVLLEIDEPEMNHNAGTITFGPDGYLYVPLGDGGAANDVGVGHPPVGNGQDTSTLLGSILRIDVDTDQGYLVPDDNPFVDEPAVADEIWAYGFRNPYRMSFDRETGDLLVGDAGQNLWEEVDRVAEGGNYGWHIREGTHCFDPANPDGSPATCAETGSRGEPLLDPVIEYANGGAPGGGLGLVVIGGYVYRGTGMPSLAGKYIFGDWSTGFGAPDGTLLVATPQENGLWPIQRLRVAGMPDGNLGRYLTAFGQGADNELYALTSENSGPSGDTGTIFRIRESGPAHFHAYMPWVMDEARIR
jgi:glucose/arabinose dehydrogenase